MACLRVGLETNNTKIILAQVAYLVSGAESVKSSSRCSTVQCDRPLQTSFTTFQTYSPYALCEARVVCVAQDIG